MGRRHGIRGGGDYRDTDPPGSFLFPAAADGRIALRGILSGKIVERFRKDAMDSDHRRNVLHDLPLPHPDHFQPDDANYSIGFHHSALQSRFRVAVPDDPAHCFYGLRPAVLFYREAVYAMEPFVSSG